MSRVMESIAQHCTLCIKRERPTQVHTGWHLCLRLTCDLYNIPVWHTNIHGSTAWINKKKNLKCFIISP